MDWHALLSELEEAEKALGDVPPDDHRPTEVMEDEGDWYCRGCQVGVSVQRLRADIEGYLAARQ